MPWLLRRDQSSTSLMMGLVVQLFSAPTDTASGSGDLRAGVHTAQSLSTKYIRDPEAGMRNQGFADVTWLVGLLARSERPRDRVNHAIDRATVGGVGCPDAALLVACLNVKQTACRMVGWLKQPRHWADPDIRYAHPLKRRGRRLGLPWAGVSIVSANPTGLGHPTYAVSIRVQTTEGFELTMNDAGITRFEP